METKLILLYKDAAIKIEIGREHFLCLSDLHIGYSPSNIIKIDSRRISALFSEKIKDLCEKTKARNLIILGDLKHKIGHITLNEQKSLSLFFSQINSYFKKIYLILGNHDACIQNFLPSNVQIVKRSFLLNKFYLMHGHTLPDLNIKKSNTIIMGHIHPLYSKENSPLNGQRVWIIIKLYLKQIYPSLTKQYNLIIMPTFNHELYLPSNYVLSHNFIGKNSPLLNRCKKDILSTKIISMEGVLLNET
ncbi:MAG: metallophosphoesterase [Nitrososphaeria archaeon]|nr:metallophosphoesterase [Nitrososphaeria archaeon]